jgi:NDP-sugar pyrophosphorylase family protein
LKAVILAAGKGTRMKHLTENQPKPMVDVGKQSILESIILAIRDAGINEFVVVTGYHANLIEDFFGDGSGFGMKVEYVRQEKQDGTGSALHICREAVGDESFFMTFGDIMTSLDNYPRMINGFRDNPCDMTLSLKWVEDPCRGAAVYLDGDSRVTKIIEKPPEGSSTTNFNNAGLFVFSPRIFDFTETLTISPRGEYELTEAIAEMVNSGQNVRGIELKGVWGDIGTPEDVQWMTKLMEERGGKL